MNKTELAVKLSQLEDFRSPTVELEQYMTPPQLAADLIHAAYMQGDIEGKKVVDLGAGTGILTIGAALADAEKVVAVEKDANAVEIAKENARKAGIEDKIEFVKADVLEFTGEYDTCVMNPPFSVHSELGDDFFRKAFSIAEAVYSLAPRDEERIKELSQEYGHEVLGVEHYTIALPASYGFHTQNERETPVDLVVTRRKD